MKTFLLFVITTLVSTATFSQDSLYSKVFYDLQSLEGEASCLSFQDGVLLVSRDVEGTNILLLDSLGEEIWSKNLTYVNGVPNFHFNQAIQTLDSCFLLAGRAYNQEDSKYEGFLAKINQSGDTVWTRTFTTNGLAAMQYDASDIYSIVQQSDSSFVFVGTAGTPGEDLDQRMLMGKIDFNGELVWSNVYESFAYSVKPRKIVTGPNNTYFITGQLYDEVVSSFYNGFLTEMTESGDLIWAKTILSLRIHDFVLQDSALFFTAESDQSQETFLLKTDLSGNAIWNNLYNWYSGSPDEKSIHLTALSDHHLLMYNHNQYGSAAMFKVDTAGNFIESKNLSLGTQNIFERANKGVYITGIGPLFGIRADIYQPQVGVIKTDSLFQQSFCIQQATPLDGLLMPTMIDTLYSLLISDTLIPRSIEITTYFYESSSFEGCVSYLGGIEETNLLVFSVYPNSSTGIFNMEQEAPEALKISVFDSQGKVIAQQKMNDYSSTIDLSQQADGIYFYKAVSLDNRMKTGKLIVAK
ncbi:MAG: T9SS type A sorting domain-containing protein [Bacteroidota bacterium]